MGSRLRAARAADPVVKSVEMQSGSATTMIHLYDVALSPAAWNSSLIVLLQLLSESCVV